MLQLATWGAFHQYMHDKRRVTRDHVVDNAALISSILDRPLA